MNKEQARCTIKAINRHVRRHDLMGGRGWPDYGVDYITWLMTYPDLATKYCRAARIYTGRDGRFMPRF